jgi:hypothetical protein
MKIDAKNWHLLTNQRREHWDGTPISGDHVALTTNQRLACLASPTE